MPEFPGLTHVAVTVTDLDRSIPFYAALFGSDPALDEDTGPFRHVVWAIGGGQLFGIHGFPQLEERRHPVGLLQKPGRVGLDEHEAAGA